jgi:hypothetical protein
MAAVRNLAIGVLAEQDRSMPPRSGSTAATSTDPWRPSDQARIKTDITQDARALDPVVAGPLVSAACAPGDAAAVARIGSGRPPPSTRRGSVLLGAADCVGSERLIANA